MTDVFDQIFKAIGAGPGGTKMPIFRYPWNDNRRGVAPVGYVKGMALCYGRMLCKRAAGDPIAMALDAPVTEGHDEDVLEWFKRQLSVAVPAVNGERYPQLLKLFVVLMGLGMEENSGQYFAGRDTRAAIWPPTAQSAEAGAFQASWALSASIAPELLTAALAPYLDTSPAPSREDCFVAVFEEGAGSPSATDPENIGAGPGYEYQVRAKSCPAYAAEFAALGLRVKRSHWGTLSDHTKVEISPEAADLFRAVQRAIAVNNITRV